MATKPVQVGNAARVGLLAAVLVEQGVRASRTALETDDGGYFKLFGGDPNAAIADLDAFAIREVAFKPYPTCRTVQSGIDAALALRDRYRGGPIAVRTYAVAVEQNGFYAEGNASRAAFSMPYLIAAALADGHVGFDTLEPARVAALASAERLVTWSIDPELDASFPNDWPAEVEIEGAPPLRVDVATGDPRNPMTAERWEAKLRTCAGSEADRLAREVAAMAQPVGV
jgi:2-methylcitrate dehydratase PrpD